MSNKNKHTNFVDHFLKTLGPIQDCPRKRCKGTMTVVYVRYKDHGPIFEELECTTCGKVLKKLRKKVKNVYRD